MATHATVATSCPNWWDEHVTLMVECLTCGIEWGWTKYGPGVETKLGAWAQEHNALVHGDAANNDTARCARREHPNAAKMEAKMKLWEDKTVPRALNDDPAPDTDATRPGGGHLRHLTVAPEAAKAGLPVMSGIVDVLNDRGFSDEPINPDAATIIEWYEQFIAPAIDNIEEAIRANPELYGILPDELV